MRWKRYDIVIDGKLYLRRYFIWRCRWFNIFLHRIYLPDHGRDPHDHPWDFVGIVLKGGYDEDRWKWFQRITRGPCDQPGRFAGYMEPRIAPSIAFRRAEDIHHISRVDPGTWTLILTGPRRREWGFIERQDNSGAYIRWRWWREYLNQWDKREID